MKRMDDTVARYDPLEAVAQISRSTRVEARTVALVLEGEIDYLNCLGLLEESGADAEALDDIEDMRRENADIIEATDGEYDTGAAISFIQRNRGIDKGTIARVLEANYRFMHERGFLDENWGEE